MEYRWLTEININNDQKLRGRSRLTLKTLRCRPILTFSYPKMIVSADHLDVISRGAKPIKYKIYKIETKEKKIRITIIPMYIKLLIH